MCRSCKWKTVYRDNNDNRRDGDYYNNNNNDIIIVCAKAFEGGSQYCYNIIQQYNYIPIAQWLGVGRRLHSVTKRVLSASTGRCHLQFPDG